MLLFNLTQLYMMLLFNFSHSDISLSYSVIYSGIRQLQLFSQYCIYFPIVIIIQLQQVTNVYRRLLLQLESYTSNFSLLIFHLLLAG